MMMRESNDHSKLRKLQHEITITEEITGADSAVVHAAKALVGTTLINS